MSPEFSPTTIDRKRHLSVAILGGFEHGKTTLAAALLARSAFRVGRPVPMPWDLYRQVARKGGVAETVHVDPFRQMNTVSGGVLALETDQRRYTLLDCPGDLRYTHNAINWLALADVGILVVSLRRGVMSVTREHVLLARQLGPRSLIVYFSHNDQENPGRADELEREVRHLLVQHEFPGDDVPMIRGDAHSALYEGPDLPLWRTIDEVLNALDLIPSPPRDEDGVVLMPVAWVERRQFAGNTVEIRGRLESGRLRCGDKLELVGAEKSQPVRVGEWIGYSEARATEAGPGEVVQFPLIAPSNRRGVRRGQILATPGTLSAHTRLAADVRLLPAHEGGRGMPIFAGFQAQFFFRNIDSTGTLHPQAFTFHPGEQQVCTIEFASTHPVVATVGQRFVLRASSQTIGLGTVREILH
jgi:elongation factor Tu